QAEVEQNLRADALVPEIRLESQLLARLAGIVPLILELVGLELVEQPDAPSFLMEVDDDAGPPLGDHPHGAVQLPAAVAARRAEDVAGQALGVRSEERRVGKE